MTRRNADLSDVPHIAFVDTMLSPVAAKANLTMVCEVDSCNNVPSLTGAVGLISLVLTGCGQRHREKARENNWEVCIAADLPIVF